MTTDFISFMSEVYFSSSISNYFEKYGPEGGKMNISMVNQSISKKKPTPWTKAASRRPSFRRADSKRESAPWTEAASRSPSLRRADSKKESAKREVVWPPLEPITVFVAGTKVDPPGAAFGPRRQPSWEFVWVRAGSVTARVNRRTIQGSAGTLMLVPSGATDRYDWSRKEKTVHSFIHFFSGAAPRVWPPEGPSIPFGPLPAGWPSPSRWPLSRNLPPGHTLFQLFRQVLSYFPLRDEKFKPLLGPAVELMLRLYLAGPAEAPREKSFDPGLSPAVEKVLPWLKEGLRNQPGRKIKLSEMARAASVSPQYLCRLFKKDLGIGPMECVRLLKTEYGGELLERSQLTIKEIAHRSGFENPFHFSRAFKEIYGLPPKTYREGFQKGSYIKPYSPLFRKYQFTRVLSIVSLKHQPPSFQLMRKKYRTPFNQ
jgi:AraC family transcriptional regulator